jgi:dipeptidyl-peptidase-4
VELYVYNLADASTTHIDTGPEKDQYVPFFEWTPAGELYFFRLNRLQNHLEIILANNNGTQKTIYEERSPKYIDGVGLEIITFMPDSKRFVIMNETETGYMHLYMYHVDRGRQYAITKGDWEVKQLIHAGDRKIWFTSNETSPIRTNLYSVDITGRNKRRLTGGEGVHRIWASKGVKYYFSTLSNASTPNLVTLHRGDGTLIRTVEENAAVKAYAAEVGLPLKEFFTIEVENAGRPVKLNCYIVKPADFDPAKKYPVLVTQYSGPGSERVLDRWSMGWEDVLVQKGYIVACCDPRGTANQGEYFKKLTYGRMGELETEDMIDFARHLGALPYVDESRIGIYGWSYGGFMALNCIFKGADVFRTAISVAPVTSWRFYDTIYTERVNGLPQDNPDGYDLTSPLGFANLLRGNLLIVHGSGDDNVHAQNTYRMVEELVRHGKDFDMMIYPDDNHSMMPVGRNHINRKMISYCLEKL